MYQIENLDDIEIIADGQAIEALGSKKLGGQGIGHVERKVADLNQRGLCKLGDGTEITNQDTIGSRILDQLEESLLR